MEVATLLGDNMVVQAERPVCLRGSTLPQTAVVVALYGDCSAQEQTVSADKNGDWSVEFLSLPAGGPYEISVTSGKQTRLIRDILSGEVWLCSGQSNMAMTVAQ